MSDPYRENPLVTEMRTVASMQQEIDRLREKYSDAVERAMSHLDRLAEARDDAAHLRAENKRLRSVLDGVSKMTIQRWNDRHFDRCEIHNGQHAAIACPGTTDDQLWTERREHPSHADCAATGHNYVETETHDGAYVQVLTCDRCQHISVGWQPRKPQLEPPQ